MFADTYWAFNLFSLFPIEVILPFIGDTWEKVQTCRWRTSECDKHEERSNDIFCHLLLSLGMPKLQLPCQAETQVSRPSSPRRFTASSLGTLTVTSQGSPHSSADGKPLVKWTALTSNVHFRTLHSSISCHSLWLCMCFIINNNNEVQTSRVSNYYILIKYMDTI